VVSEKGDGGALGLDGVLSFVGIALGIALVGIFLLGVAALAIGHRARFGSLFRGKWRYDMVGGVG
jgi:hypothetical protein